MPRKESRTSKPATADGDLAGVASCVENFRQNNQSWKRSRLEGTIAKLAKNQIFSAIDLARHGHPPSDLERAVWWYLYFTAAIDRPPRGYSPDENFAAQAHEWRANLSSEFFEALENLDSNALRAIADAVDAFRTAPEVEPRRVYALELKDSLDCRNESMTVAEVARFFAANLGLIYGSENGYASLRRLLKEIAFPIKASINTRNKRQRK